MFQVVRQGKSRADLYDRHGRHPHSRELIVAALTHCDGDRTKAASLLGLSRSQLYRLVKTHNLDGDTAGNGSQESDWMQ